MSFFALVMPINNELDVFKQKSCGFIYANCKVIHCISMLQFIAAAYWHAAKLSGFRRQIFEALFLGHKQHVIGNVSIEMVQITGTAGIPGYSSSKIFLHTIAKECLEQPLIVAERMSDCAK